MMKLLIPTLLLAVSAGCASYAAEFYQLQTYSLKKDKGTLLDEYLSKAYLPALARMGIGPVGVFSEKGTENVYVLTVLKSLDELAALPGKLAQDDAYKTAAATYLAVKPADAVYDRVETSILAAIEGVPNIVKPDTTKPRLMNLRIYESHNERAAAKKIEMFNTSELAVFRKVGLTPVLFGSSLAGPRLPNLTYMLVFPDDEGRGAAWKKFGGDPDWQKLKAIPEFADKEIVSKITNKILTPKDYSGI